MNTPPSLIEIDTVLRVEDECSGIPAIRFIIRNALSQPFYSSTTPTEGCTVEKDLSGMEFIASVQYVPFANTVF